MSLFSEESEEDGPSVAGFKTLGSSIDTGGTKSGGNRIDVGAMTSRDGDGLARSMGEFDLELDPELDLGLDVI
jgi:hypothetical protein